MLKKTLYLSIIIMLLSCGKEQNSYFSGNNYSCVEVKECSTLKGEIIINNLIGINDFDIVGNHIILTTPSDSSLFKIYNLSGDFISVFGTKGNGPDDLINCQLNGQKEIRGKESLTAQFSITYEVMYLLKLPLFIIIS